MANICNFKMMVTGKRENVEKFISVLTHESRCWMGRGASIDEIEWDEDGRAWFNGCCKWSLKVALVLNARSMQEQKITGEGYWADIDDADECITLWKACERFNVNMEAYSEETGCCFQEHLKYENGEIFEDVVDYYEKYDEESGDYCSIGGYDSWDFDLLDVA